jgi:hypothetical protein
MNPLNLHTCKDFVNDSKYASILITSLQFIELIDMISASFQINRFTIKNLLPLRIFMLRLVYKTLFSSSINKKIMKNYR